MITLPDGRLLYHTPTPDLPADAQTALADFWNSATTSLFIVDYSFNLPTIEGIIEGLLTKGVQVTLVLDKSQSAGSTEVPLIESLRGITNPLFKMVIGTSSMHGIVHDKFSVVDGTHAEYGLFNYTLAAGKEDNFFFIESNSEVAPALLGIGENIMAWIVANEPQGAIMGVKGDFMNEPVFKLSVPTQSQVVKGIYVVVGVFLVAAFGEWKLFPHPFSKAALLAAGLAGATAVFQFVSSSVTTL